MATRASVHPSPESDPQTFPQLLLLRHAAHRPHATAIREKQYGIW
ncbi:hypothetical protein [Piscinibacter sp.]